MLSGDDGDEYGILKLNGYIEGKNIGYGYKGKGC